MSNKTPHPQAELLTAIAAGEQMQRKNCDEWVDCDADAALYRLSVGMETRIKPEVKPDQEFHMEVGFDQDFKYPYMRRPEHYERPNLHLVFDGETGKLKSAEVVL